MSAPLLSSSPAATGHRAVAFRHAMARDVLRGLRAEQKTLPAKLFYDAEGAALFERICELDEYYLTRAELRVLRAHADDIARLAGGGCALIEYGSGSGRKVRLLLDALRSPSAYVPVDISREQLRRVARELALEYPGIRVRPVGADYTRPFRLPDLPVDVRRLAFFPGSTIGNFDPPQAAAFLRRVRHTVGDDGALVIGVDRRKDERTLNLAYNDAAGVTAAFNLNMLTRLNRELGATFDLGQFRHVAFFDGEASRIEMHLECTESTVVQVAGESIDFTRGETIWTESSYKYDATMLDALAAGGGFHVEKLWTDPADQFWVAVLAA